jgi:hypothetical protein
MSAPRIVWQRGGAFVGVEGDLVAVRWTGVPSGEQLAALEQAHARACVGGRGAVLLDVIGSLDAPPRVDHDLHARIVALIERCRGRTRAVAHAVELGGAPGAVVRAFLVALERVAGDGRTRVATFAHAEHAAAWLARARPDLGAHDAVATWRAMQQGREVSLAA